jgi:hypothetical protein
MKTTVVCREVHPLAGNNQVCAVIASQVERAGVRVFDPTDTSNVADVKDWLHAQGIVLGGTITPQPKGGHAELAATARADHHPRR